MSNAERYIERVLALVETIPAGKAMSYGEVAERLGEGGPRQVGRVMTMHGRATNWHRVIYADGRPPPGLAAEALARWKSEGTPVDDRGRVRMAEAQVKWGASAGAPEQAPE